jgi:putative acetyltransferase
LQVDLDERSLQAIGFYDRPAFDEVVRSPVDDQGRPYPLIQIERRDARQN